MSEASKLELITYGETVLTVCIIRYYETILLGYLDVLGYHVDLPHILYHDVTK